MITQWFNILAWMENVIYNWTELVHYEFLFMVPRCSFKYRLNAVQASITVILARIGIETVILHILNIKVCHCL